MFSALKIGAFTLLVLFAAASCSTSKAQIDFTFSEGILWPGAPERPRIKYLWSLRRVSGSPEGVGKVVRVIAGEGAAGEVFGDFLTRPHSVYVDESETLYITDTGSFRVNVIDLKTMKSFVVDKAGRLPLLFPIGVVADRQGRIYVSDADMGKVAVFNKKGKFLSFFEGDFKRPTGMAINLENDLLYVADTWDHSVHIYNMHGKRLGSIGQRGEGPGRMNYPTHISVDREGFIYVSDTLNFRVQVFTPSGRLFNSFGLVGDSFDSFDKIKGISVDSEGHIYIVDSAQDMVKIYDRDGNMLLFFGREGHFYGDFFLPAGMHIDVSDRIYVSDSLNGRVQAFQFIGGD